MNLLKIIYHYKALLNPTYQSPSPPAQMRCFKMGVGAAKRLDM